jgi:GH24 family phage-related lysozyme (muramidase)
LSFFDDDDDECTVLGSKNTPKFIKNQLVNVLNVEKMASSRLPPYETRKGNGDWTVGYGHKIKKGEPYYPYGNVRSITEQQANSLFDADVKREGEDKVNSWVNVSLTQLQFDALVSMAFNAPGLCKSLVIPLVNQGKHIEAAATIKTAQSSSAPFSVYPGLKKRREKEAAIYLQGSYE